MNGQSPSKAISDCGEAIFGKNNYKELEKPKKNNVYQVRQI